MNSDLHRPSIVIDNKIPFIQGVLEPYAEVSYCEGTAINRGVVANADALIVRTRTRCDEALLKNSPVKFIATATIGTDHIDTAYCDANGIFWTNAAGCNSGSVYQYIASVLAWLCRERNCNPEASTLGVVGCGHGHIKAKTKWSLLTAFGWIRRKSPILNIDSLSFGSETLLPVSCWQMFLLKNGVKKRIPPDLTGTVPSHVSSYVTGLFDQCRRH